MAKAELIATPFGVAQYPSVNKPDTVGEFATGKYKISIVVSKEDLAKFQADFTAKAGPFPKGHKLPWREKDGVLIITAKSKFAPLIVDAQKQPIPFGESEYLAAGSEVRLLAEIGAYKGGNNLFLKKVQVKNLVKGSAGSGVDFEDFGEEDDFEADDALDL